MDKSKIQSCSSCGDCCRLFLINLNKKEWESGEYETQFQEFNLKDDYLTAKEYGGNLLKQKKDGSCIYLQNNLCFIHQRRPQACRDFFCKSKSKKFQRMIEVINNFRASF